MNKQPNQYSDNRAERGGAHPFQQLHLKLQLSHVVAYKLDVALGGKGRLHCAFQGVLLRFSERLGLLFAEADGSESLGVFQCVKCYRSHASIITINTT